MPWQVILKRKDGTTRTDFYGGAGPAPHIGEVINYPIDGGIVKARITAVQSTPVGEEIGQPLDFAHADEI